MKKQLTVERRAKNFFDSTFLTAGCSITRMNSSSSQTELVQSWGLGHSSPMELPTTGQSKPTTTTAPVGRSVHWMGCIFSFSAGWGSSQSISYCCWPLYFFFFGSWPFFPGLDLTHSYLAHFFTLIGIVTTLVPYLLSPIDTTTLITSYPIDLATVLTTYPTNLTTLLITYPTNLTTILTT